jgi:hypothetical protein
MNRPIVDPSRSTRSRTTESIDRDPSVDLVVHPGLLVSPAVQFPVDPGEEGCGARVESVGESLGLGLLKEIVA